MGEPAEQVVEGQDAEPLLALVELGSDRDTEPDPLGDPAARLGVDGCQLGLGVVDDPARDAACRGRVERGLVAPVPVPLEEEVVADLTTRSSRFSTSSTRIGVACDAERGEHEVTELVGGGDGGAVEPGECVGDAATPRRDLVVGAVQRGGR